MVEVVVGMLYKILEKKKSNPIYLFLIIGSLRFPAKYKFINSITFYSFKKTKTVTKLSRNLIENSTLKRNTLKENWRSRRMNGQDRFG